MASARTKMFVDQKCRCSGDNGGVVTVADVRALALTLPRTTEHLIRDRVKFRVKQIVYSPSAGTRR